MPPPAVHWRRGRHVAAILMDNIAHRYTQDGAHALQPMTMEWRDGGAYALLGPSGCGKTTLLNIISGLVAPSDGRVVFDGRDVTHLPPQERNIAQVFQFPVVYDSMTVAENLEFPLRNQGLDTAQRRRRVAEVLELLELTHAARHKARNLGADSKQKISLGRGLVRTGANAILLDEPLTVIDPALKWELRAQLKKVHQQIGHTMIYVTHDQTEALTVADQVVVMLEGRVLQVGTPQELFDRPAHTFVGTFIGSPGMNLLPCTVGGSTARVEDTPVPLGADYGSPPGALELGIRPEHIRLAAGAAGGLPVTVRKVDDLGREQIVHARLGSRDLAIILREGEAVPDNPVALFDTDYLHLYADGVRVPRPGAEGTP